MWGEAPFGTLRWGANRVAAAAAVSSAIAAATVAHGAYVARVTLASAATSSAATGAAAQAPHIGSVGLAVSSAAAAQAAQTSASAPRGVSLNSAAAVMVPGPVGSIASAARAEQATAVQLATGVTITAAARSDPATAGEVGVVGVGPQGLSVESATAGAASASRAVAFAAGSDGVESDAELLGPVSLLAGLAAAVESESAEAARAFAMVSEFDAIEASHIIILGGGFEFAQLPQQQVDAGAARTASSVATAPSIDGVFAEMNMIGLGLQDAAVDPDSVVAFMDSDSDRLVPGVLAAAVLAGADLVVEFLAGPQFVGSTRASVDILIGRVR